MNPWQSLRREIDGAIRSVRYGLGREQARCTTRGDTVPMVLRGVGWAAGDRQALARHRGAGVAARVAAGRRVCGYVAVTGGFDASIPDESTPNGLPATPAEQRMPPPSPSSRMARRHRFLPPTRLLEPAGCTKMGIH